MTVTEIQKIILDNFSKDILFSFGELYSLLSRHMDVTNVEVEINIDKALNDLINENKIIKQFYALDYQGNECFVEDQDFENEMYANMNENSKDIHNHADYYNPITGEDLTFEEFNQQVFEYYKII